MEYTTITISTKLKRKLEAIKGDLSWDEFLDKIAEEMIKERRIRSAEKLLKKFPLSKEECNFILKVFENSRVLLKKKK